MIQPHIPGRWERGRVIHVTRKRRPIQVPEHEHEGVTAHVIYRWGVRSVVMEKGMKVQLRAVGELCG